MILLLDTTVLIDALHPRRTRRAFLADLVRSRHRLATTTINVAEVYAGMRSGEEERTEAFLSDIELYTLTASIARRAGTLKHQHARLGRTFSLADMIVAATALEYDLTLVTDNVKDFDVPGVHLHPMS